MFEWLNENPLIVLAVLVVVVFVLMFAFVKVKKKKPKKEESAKTEMPDKPDENSADESGSAEQTEEPPIKLRAKKARTRPQIEQIYKRSVAKTQAEAKPEEKDEFKGKEAQFVKSTNKVSKFVGFEEVSKKEEELAVRALQEMQESQTTDDCELCEPKAKHFDHTRRLSKMIQEDSFDDMLDAHISGHYLNIDEKRHLRISEDFSEKLFDRAMKTLSNSGVKVLVDEEDSVDKPLEKMRGDKEFMKQWLADRKRENMAAFVSTMDTNQETELDEETLNEIENDVDLSPKNIIVVDSIVNRKGKRKR